MNESIPAFFGTVNSNTSKIGKRFSHMKNVISNKKVSIHVTSNCDLKNYKLIPSGFLWTGGYHPPKTCDAISFDKVKCDSKFIFVEIKGNSVSISSDHYSRIPLYYVFKNDALYFSSSLKLLLEKVPEFHFQINEKGLIFYYSFGFPLYNEFPAKEIKSLPAGYTLLIDKQERTLFKYYDIISFSQ